MADEDDFMLDDYDNYDEDYEWVLDDREIETRRVNREMKLERRRMRDASNPILGRSTHNFMRHFRLDQQLFLSLVDLIRPHMRYRISPLAIPLERRVCIAFVFFFSFFVAI